MNCLKEEYMQKRLFGFITLIIFLIASPGFTQINHNVNKVVADAEITIPGTGTSYPWNNYLDQDANPEWRDTGNAMLIRGPYLQSGTAFSMVIRWRTDIATNSRIRYGSSPALLTNMVDSIVDSTEHEIKLTGLTPFTKYYYSIGSTTVTLQGDTANYFSTLPVQGSTALLRIGVFGDCGNNSTNQIQVRDRVQDYLGSNYMNAWILLGDNAYDNGTDADFQAEFFNIYQSRFMKQSSLYPCPGNHDYANNSVIQNSHNMPYYDIFSMPAMGEAGGVPSNNKAYYSFNIGNIHFLSLDSYGMEDNATRLYDTLGRQVQWIKADLAANTNKGWVVAYWHHPPFTKGSHNSDTESELVNIRSNFIRILERMDVDLILCGHSHVYERSKLQSGHYDVDSTFDPAVHNLSTSTGLYDGSANSCPYIKDSVTHKQGTVYVVSGSAGQLGGMQPDWPHKAMYYSNAVNGGAMMLEVQGNRLDAKWICADGVIRDHFTMMKNVNRKKDTAINAGSSIILTASYTGNYTWQPTNQTTKSITVTPSAGNTSYIVKDNLSCIADTFNVTAASILPITWGSIKGWYEKGNKTIQLQWQTLSETDNKYFDIERSADGTNFNYIGKVISTGNSNTVITYDFTDKNINANVAIYYYRIRQTDANGNYRYSPVVAIKLTDNKTDIDVQVTPNPGRSSEMKIRLLNRNTLSATLKLTDASGKLITTQHVELNASLQSFLRDVQPGIYFITITSEVATVTKQIVVK